jgi:L-amino acid N-acyltransferase YncA
MIIRTCEISDAAAICEIYNHYVRETVVTFEESPVPVQEMARRIGDVGARHPWLILEDQGRLAGYSCAAQWKARSAYRFTVETTVYLAADRVRKGMGTALYGALIAQLRERRFHCAIGIIALPNPASVALHEKQGFRQVGRFDEVGRKFDRWVDVGYWALRL